MKPSPLKLGIIGAFAYFASVAWVFLCFRIASRHDPPGWIVDRATPDAPKLVAIVGVGFLLVSVLWAVVRLIRRRPVVCPLPEFVERCLSCQMLATVRLQ